jgi:class 3 adenylate cyclase
MLNTMFSHFDDLTDEHGVYKVETIGDAYMVAAGHLSTETDPVETVRKVLSFASHMLKIVNEELPESIKSGSDSERLEIRIGVHCGQAHTGVVGTKMPRFCFFGDTINTASRMESTSYPSCIQVSDSVYDIAKGMGGMDFVEYGTRPVKGKGNMSTYVGEGRKGGERGGNRVK